MNRPKRRQPHCGICGRFARAVRDDQGRIIDWRFTCVIWDDYMGGWEHE